LTVPVTAAVVVRKHLLNPILAGAALWLWLGAIAFQVPVEPLVRWLGRTQALGLFLAALGLGFAALRWSPHGYVGCRSDDSAWVRRASIGLLAGTLGAAVLAWLFRHDVRLGGGLPFIALNVARRVVCARAPGPPGRVGRRSRKDPSFPVNGGMFRPKSGMPALLPRSPGPR
jgi:hypothetical protein